MAEITGTRQDRWLVSVSVDGSPLGTFDKVEGGDVDSAETKYRPGGMGPEIPLGGPQTVNNITVARLYDLGRDHDVARQMSARVGKARVTVSKQPLDEDGNPWGTPQIYTGKLKTVMYPDGDSTGSGASMLSLVVSTAGSIA